MQLWGWSKRNRRVIDSDDDLNTRQFLVVSRPKKLIDTSSNSVSDYRRLVNLLAYNDEHDPSVGDGAKLPGQLLTPFFSQNHALLSDVFSLVDRFFLA